MRVDPGLVDRRPPFAVLRPPDVVAVAVPLYRAHDAVEPNRPDGEEEVKELKSLLVTFVDLLLTAALHAVLRLPLLPVDIFTRWTLVQLVAHLQPDG